MQILNLGIFKREKDFGIGFFKLYVILFKREHASKISKNTIFLLKSIL